MDKNKFVIVSLFKNLIECSTNCLTCSNTIEYCKSCVPERELDQNHRCVCVEGRYEDNEKCPRNNIITYYSL